MQNWSVLFLLVLLSCASPKKIPVPRELSLFDPSQQDQKVVELDHHYFKIGYDPEMRLARYVVYELHAERLKARGVKRKNRFRVDQLLKKLRLPFVESKEYSGTGYDRGHLAPAADFAWNEEASDQTFVMSNMAPQRPNLNRDAWKRLEEKVRRWACGEKHIRVITGPLFNQNNLSLKSGLIVPDRFFKIVIDETPPTKAIAFIYHQEDRGDLLKERMVPLQDLAVLSQNHPQIIPSYRKLERTPASLDQWKEEDCR